MQSNTSNESSKEVGFVISAQDYLLYLSGLPSVHVNDILVSEKGGRALVTSLARDKIEALMLDGERPFPGDYFEKSPTGLSLSISNNLFGRTINPLGVALDGKPGLPPKGVAIDLDAIAPGINFREIVSEQLQTGITVVDTLLPIGIGQRELIFGDPRSGKSSFLMDIIINQKDKNVICLYAAIGKSEIDVKKFGEKLEAAGGASYTILLAATSSESAPIISIAPSVACSIAEAFRNEGKTVLMILDDLGTHSKYLREIALLGGRIPGRESYPADIFYQHSHLIERAGNFNNKVGGGSITLLPVIETDLENFTNLIPTNIMSMTDGHILFSAALRAEGQYPAIEPGRSVTRVGYQTQLLIQKELADKVRYLLAEYHEMERYGRFSGELTSATQLTIKIGNIATELLRQEPLMRIEPMVQVLLLTLLYSSFFDEKDIEFARKYKTKIIEALTTDPVFKNLAAKATSMKLTDLIAELKKNQKTIENLCR